MLNPDFSERTYTVEVLETKADSVEAILSLTRGIAATDEIVERNGVVKLYHAFLPSAQPYHRYTRTVERVDGESITIPRQIEVRKKTQSLYDVLIAQSKNHVLVAVPFHQMAEHFFVKVDTALSGTGIGYEKLNITRLVMTLGEKGRVEVPTNTDEKLSLSLTRCHLAYVDREGVIGSLKQIQMTGSDLGAAKEYQTLVAPVLDQSEKGPTVTPIVLGFALNLNGVKRSSATTDRHGNFKLWVAPGLKRVTRVFELLEAIRALRKVATTTVNVPILQARAIRDTEE
jgi:hypothetical protein